MAKFELTEKDLEQVNGGTTINFFGMQIEITPQIIQTAINNGTASQYFGYVNTLASMYPNKVRELKAEYASSGIPVPPQLQSVFNNIN